MIFLKKQCNTVIFIFYMIKFIMFYTFLSVFPSAHEALLSLIHVQRSWIGLCIYLEFHRFDKNSSQVQTVPISHLSSRWVFFFAFIKLPRIRKLVIDLQDKIKRRGFLMKTQRNANLFSRKRFKVLYVIVIFMSITETRINSQIAKVQLANLVFFAFPIYLFDVIGNEVRQHFVKNIPSLQRLRELLCKL